jgi:hypothetical protein
MRRRTRLSLRKQRPVTRLPCIKSIDERSPTQPSDSAHASPIHHRAAADCDQPAAAAIAQVGGCGADHARGRLPRGGRMHERGVGHPKLRHRRRVPAPWAGLNSGKSAVASEDDSRGQSRVRSCYNLPARLRAVFRDRDPTERKPRTTPGHQSCRSAERASSGSPWPAGTLSCS